MEPHVFVVMPFNVKEVQAKTDAAADAPAKPAIKVDFDDVYKLLIAPALTKAGCLPFRADQEAGAGDIRTDMYFELVTAEVIVADISILNANVFYELGVRHGVAPRGVLMIHGGWSKRPFDVAPDRTFDYDGEIFVPPAEQRDDAWQRRLEAAVESLATMFRNALAVDEQTIGSPVYKELVGLKPVDWRDIQTARAKYFGQVSVEWKARVEVAKANGLPGDILTLANDAPTRFHRGKLLWEAATSLVSMHRFDTAKTVLDELLLLEPTNIKALTQMGVVLGRLNQTYEAKVHMTRVADEYAGDPEAQGILGRVYKDLWRAEWQELPTLPERQRQAIDSSGYAVSAMRSYDLAQRNKLNSYYVGINVISILMLLEHLKTATGDEPVDYEIEDLADLIAVVRLASKEALSCASRDAKHEDQVWSTATLAELELLAGDPAKARKLYRDAANTPDVSYFQVKSMLDQICLFESLGFRPDAVAPVKAVLEQRGKALEQKTGGIKKSEPRFKKVVVFSGHMVDKPDRPKPRFPPAKETTVRERMAQQLKLTGVGAGDLAICGGAQGGDILFAELCADMGAEVWLFIALPDAEFLEESVRLSGSDWEQRYFALRDRAGVKVFNQHDRLKSPPKGTSVFARNNLWMLNTARVEADDPKNLHAVLVWDEQPTGDGPGGTSDFAVRVKKIGGRLAPIINPTTL